jgi:hypothetical protein
MRRLTILPLLLVFTGSLAAQAAHFSIVDLTAELPLTGGDVFITFGGSYGSTLTATLDGVPVPARETIPFGITVTAPAHARGPAILKLGGTTPDSSATVTLRYVTNDDYERVLIPILINDFVPGANGSKWTTEVWAWNGGSEFIDVFGNFPILFQPAPPTPPPLHLVPDAAQRVRALAQIEGGGAILRVPRWPGRAIAFNARVADISRQAASWGTEMPFVRESTFANSQMLLNVPGDPRFRVLLRVYTLDGPARVHVRGAIPSGLLVITEPPLPNPVFDTKLDVPAPPAGGFFPGFAQLPIAAFGAAVQMQIAITAEDPSQKIWAFVSITNNDTQQVTLVTPQ